MKKWTILLAILVALPVVADDERELIDEVVARVNNQIITLTELREANQSLREEILNRVSGEELDAAYQEQSKDSLRNLIDMALLVQYGNDQGYSVEADVIRELDRMRQQNNLKDMEELERAMAAQGVNIEDVKQRYREQIMYQMVIQRDVARSVFFNDEEIQSFYDEHKEEFQQPARVRLREILISTASRSPEEATERTREALAKIRKGDAFEDVAREYSDAPTAASGGDLGNFEPENLSEQVRELTANLRINGVADPQLTPEGYLILQLAERYDGGVPPVEQAREAIQNSMYMERVQPAFRKFLERMRRGNYVFVKAGYTDSGAIPLEDKPVLRGRRRRSVRSNN